MARSLYERVVALADRIATFGEAPKRTREERAVHDAWSAALKPRMANMRRHAEWVADPRHWAFDDEREPERLQAAAWSLALRELAALYTQLAGALFQYERFRIVWTPRTRFGIVRGASRRVPEGKSKDRAKMQETAKKALADAKKAKVKAAEQLLDGIVKALDARRKALGDALDEVRYLTAALQADEEARLARRVDRMAEGSKAREKAEDLLVELARGRLRAARHGEERAAGWGSLLRAAWLAPRARLVGLVDGP